MFLSPVCQFIPVSICLLQTPLRDPVLYSSRSPIWLQQNLQCQTQTGTDHKASWGYLVYTGDISSIWPLFGISNQLLASVTLLIGTTMLLRMNKTKYAWITAAPGIFMTFITFWAGIWLILYQYIPTQKYLLASLSVLVMVMMGFVIIGTLRRWSVLLKETKIVRDPYGDEVKEIVQE